MNRLSEVLAGGKVTHGSVARVREHLLYDRGEVRDKYSRYFLMLFLSSIIATGGILEDSAAVVVGAMIIAPLMTPMLATAFSTITGDWRNAVRSFLVTAVGAALVVLVAAVVTSLAPAGVHLAGNAQVVSRTAPRLIDLLIALAAGAAGAVAVVRKDVAEVLPGVAVAVSIVPPLCVAGAAFAGGSPSLAYGALLLFMTNFFAVQLAGCAVFASMGFGGVARQGTTRHARNVGVAVAIIGTLLLTLPLAATSGQLARDATLENKATNAVQRWLKGTDYESLSVVVKSMVVTVQITGRGVPPQTGDLARLLSSGDPQPSRVRVLILPQELAGTAPLESSAPAVIASEAVVPKAGVETTSSVETTPPSLPTSVSP